MANLMPTMLRERNQSFRSAEQAANFWNKLEEIMCAVWRSTFKHKITLNEEVSRTGTFNENEQYIGRGNKTHLCTLYALHICRSPGLKFNVNEEFKKVKAIDVVQHAALYQKRIVDANANNRNPPPQKQYYFYLQLQDARENHADRKLVTPFIATRRRGLMAEKASITKDDFIEIPFETENTGFAELQSLNVAYSMEFNPLRLIKGFVPKYAPNNVDFKQHVFDALEQMVGHKLNDDDEMLLIVSILYSRRNEVNDTDSKEIIYCLALIKGRSLIFINLDHSFAESICDIDVASNDISQILPEHVNAASGSNVIAFFPLKHHIKFCNKELSQKMFYSSLEFNRFYISKGNYNIWTLNEYFRAIEKDHGTVLQFLNRGGSNEFVVKLNSLHPTPMVDELKKILSTNVSTMFKLVQLRNVMSKYSPKSSQGTYKSWHSNTIRKEIIQSENIETRSMICRDDIDFLTSLIGDDESDKEDKLLVITELHKVKVHVCKVLGAEMVVLANKRLSKEIEYPQLQTTICSAMSFGQGFLAPMATDLTEQPEVRKYFRHNFKISSVAFNERVGKSHVYLQCTKELSSRYHTYSELQNMIYNFIVGKRPRNVKFEKAIIKLAGLSDQQLEENEDEEKKEADVDDSADDVELEGNGGNRAKNLIKSMSVRKDYLLQYMDRVLIFYQYENNRQYVDAIYAWYHFIRGLYVQENLDANNILTNFRAEEYIRLLSRFQPHSAIMSNLRNTLENYNIVDEQQEDTILPTVEAETNEEDQLISFQFTNLDSFIVNFVSKREEWREDTDSIVSTIEHIYLFTLLICGDISTYFPFQATHHIQEIHVDDLTEEEQTKYFFRKRWNLPSFKNDNQFKELLTSLRLEHNNDEELRDYYELFRHSYQTICNILLLDIPNYLIFSTSRSRYVTGKGHRIPVLVNQSATTRMLLRIKYQFGIQNDLDDDDNDNDVEMDEGKKLDKQLKRVYKELTTPLNDVLEQRRPQQAEEN